MPNRLDAIAPPAAPIYRVARRGTDPFGPPPWEFAAADGTFGGRFDDPGGRIESFRWRDPVPVDRRFRIVYCATTASGAFGETLARFRPALDNLFLDPDYVDDPESPEPITTNLIGTRDPDDLQRVVVPAGWRSHRVLAATHLDHMLRFVDLASPTTLNSLRAALAPLARSLGLSDVDFGAVLSPHREFTQECARYLYQLQDERGNPRYAGIRYLSRLNPGWECWAVFDNRLRHTAVNRESIVPDHPALQDVAALYQLTIELSDGRYLRPT